ncbi:hypothetical protein HNR23_003929 [Nocardiopsis mwathae]|uniref:DUF2637 domain-containing protein n=1 Tax=Nocardiopsis mwathae TaxID=1472723 RepID=A0A7X0D8C4_9ACTN|nr:hypothetical protein [Nocardiopsis mwathae]MBB6173869.1 hypothetical protein [Nocardiopsis mwathae]
MAVKPSSESTGPRLAPEPAGTGSPLPAIALTGVGVLLIAASAVLLSYNGIYQIALLGGIEPRYAHLYPAGFTLLLLMSFGASYLLRAAPRPRRLWADALILALILLAAGASALHATGTAMPKGLVVVAVAATPWLALLVAFRVFMWVYMHLRGEGDDEPRPAAAPRPRRPVPPPEATVPAAPVARDEPAAADVETTAPISPPAAPQRIHGAAEHEEGDEDRPRKARRAQTRRREPSLLWPRSHGEPQAGRREEKAAEEEAAQPPAEKTGVRPAGGTDATATPVAGVHLLRPVETADGPEKAGPAADPATEHEAAAEPMSADEAGPTDEARGPAAAELAEPPEPNETAEAAARKGAVGRESAAEPSVAEAAPTADPVPPSAPQAPEAVAEPADRADEKAPADGRGAHDAGGAQGERDEWADKADAIEAIRRAEEAREAAIRAEEARAEQQAAQAGRATADAVDAADGPGAPVLPRRTPGSGNPIKLAAEPTPVPRPAEGRTAPGAADPAVVPQAAEGDDGFPHDIVPADPTSDEAESVAVRTARADHGRRGDQSGRGDAEASYLPDDASDPDDTGEEERAPIGKRPMVLKPRRQPMSAFPFPADPPSRSVRSEPTPPQD